MKRMIGVFGLTALMLVPSIVSAQKRAPVGFGLSGGLSMPMGDFGDSADMGYVIGGQIWLLPAATIGFRADVNYDSWDLKKSATFSSAKVTFRSISGAANVVIRPTASSKSMLKPYLIAGGGMFNTQASSSSQSSASKTNAGIQAGGGIELKLSGFSTFIEGKYVNVFTDVRNTNWIPVTFGVRLQP